jgi:hypothetical protein
MRLGWYLLIYAGVAGAMGVAYSVLGVYLGSIAFPGSGSPLAYEAPWMLSALIPLLAALIGGLLLRRSAWLTLSIWTYLGFAIPTAIGVGYLLWRNLSQSPIFTLGTNTFSSIAVFLEWFSHTAGNLWFAYLVALCGCQAPPEKLGHFWRRGIGVFLLLWGLLIVSPWAIRYWFDDMGQSKWSRMLDVWWWLGALDALVWLVLGWSLIRGKGWLPATALALGMKIALYTAKQLVGMGIIGAVSGWSGVFSSGWVGWRDPFILMAWLSGKLYFTLLEVAPIALMLTFLMPAFPNRLMRYTAMWRHFRRQRIERQRL